MILNTEQVACAQYIMWCPQLIRVLHMQNTTSALQNQKYDFAV